MLSAPRWKPGDVAVWESSAGRVAAIRSHQGHWNGHDAHGGSYTRRPNISGARPLVVIDPEDREQVERLYVEYRVAYYGESERTIRPRTSVATAFQAALRSLIADPKPDEPQGLGAVVEDAEGRRWVRVFGGEANPGLSPASGPWKPAHMADALSRRLYADITAVRILAPGWSE